MVFPATQALPSAPLSAFSEEMSRTVRQPPGAHLVVLGVQPKQVVEEALIDGERVLVVEARWVQDMWGRRAVELLARVYLWVGQVPQAHHREGAEVGEGERQVAPGRWLVRNGVIFPRPARQQPP